MPELAVLVATGEKAPPLDAAASAAAAASSEVVVVVGAPPPAPPAAVTVVVDESPDASEATGLRAVADYAARAGATALLVALAPALGAEATDAEAWVRLAEAEDDGIVVATRRGRPVGLVRLPARTWPLLPFEGPLVRLLSAHPELVSELALEAGSASASVASSGDRPSSDDDVAAVTALLGRPPAGGFSVAVRAADGSPVVIRNAPFLDDGTPMPTRYWLVGRTERELVSRLEAARGVRRAEEALPAAEIAAAHARYADERQAAIPAGHPGPLPAGGVGGTREGVKCLHAHLAWYLAGGADPVGRWVAAELSPSLPGPVASVDCGTNSTRLLVLGRDGSASERQLTITRLGESVDRTSSLAESAIGRTLDALRRYRGVMDHHGVVRLRAAATSAVRDATNGAVFLDGAALVLGARPELLAGVEEGRLSYLGATADLDPGDGPFLVCDLGGGSTELVVGGDDPAAEPVAVVSLDVGCVRVRERFFSSDPPSPTELAAARSFVAATLSPVLSAHPELARAKTMVGVAGTVSTLVALEFGLDEYDSAAVHLCRISRARVEAWAAALAAETTAERCRRRVIEPGRADVIAAGATILAELMARLGYDELVHSERDILDGLAESLLASPA